MLYSFLTVEAITILQQNNFYVTNVTTDNV